MTTQTLNVRIDKNTKLQAQKVVEKLGLDLSSAIKLFINKLVMTESIPFDINTKGRMNNPRFVAEIKKELEWASKHGKKYSSAKEMFDDILR
jgi:DNA-damage-inducible protein J